MDEKKNITPVLSDETDAASVPDAGELRRKKKRQRQLVTSILLVVFAAVLIAVYFIVAPLLSDRDRGCIGLRTSKLRGTLAHISEQ